MIAKTAQWGNSIGVRIPKDLARKAGIGLDATVEIAEAEEGIIIKPVGKKSILCESLLMGLPVKTGTMKPTSDVLWERSCFDEKDP